MLKRREMERISDTLGESWKPVQNPDTGGQTWTLQSEEVDSR